MTDDVYCSMIHGGLHLVLDEHRSGFHHCCLRDDQIFLFETADDDFWHDKRMIPLRQINQQGNWDADCAGCHSLEKSGQISMRQGMNSGLDIFGKYDFSGPARIDLKFDISCNLACRTCGPHSSSFWQRHLKQNNSWLQPIAQQKKAVDAIEVLQKLDLSNLRQLVFCGGETLLGNEYWKVAEWLTKNVPNSRENLTLSFQTNGTQSIPEKWYDVIQSCKLVKLHISIDGAGSRFEYLRWPANWNQVTDNILDIRTTCPSNVMFVIEETISIFNLLYLNETQKWVSENFNSNREGDLVDHTRHLAHGIFSLKNCSQEYVDLVKTTPAGSLLPASWTEDPRSISKMIDEIKKFDRYRSQDFSIVFPEVAEMYRRFL